MQPWLIGVIIGLIVTLSIVPLLQNREKSLKLAKKVIGVYLKEEMNDDFSEKKKN